MLTGAVTLSILGKNLFYRKKTSEYSSPKEYSSKGYADVQNQKEYKHKWEATLKNENFENNISNKHWKWEYVLRRG